MHPPKPKGRGSAPDAPPEHLFYHERDTLLDGVQGVLDLVGFIPGIGEAADLVNAGISAARGNPLDAALSLISLIPGVGDTLGKGARYALKFSDAVMAHKVLLALQSADRSGFFHGVAKHPQLAQYVPKLREALDTLAGRLASLAGVPKPHLSMARGPAPRDVPLPKKRGDHVFNHGLTKLQKLMPGNPRLVAPFRRFLDGLAAIQQKGHLRMVSHKAADGVDENAEFFGRTLDHLRTDLARLDHILGDSHANAQHRASAVLLVVNTLKVLRRASFDEAAAKARKLGVSNAEKKKVDALIDATAQELDGVFDTLEADLRKLTSAGAVGLSMAGRRS